MKSYTLHFELENKNYLDAWLKNEQIDADIMNDENLKVVFHDIDSAFKARMALDHLIVE